MSTDITVPETVEQEALHARATRYAQALAAAAAADARVAELTEQLAEHEYLRTQAELALDGVRYDPAYGTVYQPTGDEPDEEVKSLLCLYTGDVFQRYSGHGGGWVLARRQERGQTIQMWPINDHGPFIGWREEWGFSQTLKSAREADEEIEAAHVALREHRGYRADDAGWSRPRLAEAINRIHMAALAAFSERERASQERAYARGVQHGQDQGQHLDDDGEAVICTCGNPYAKPEAGVR